MMPSIHRLLSATQTEAARMAAVRRYEALDTPPESTFDHITSLVAEPLGTPLALISIVDQDRVRYTRACRSRWASA